MGFIAFQIPFRDAQDFQAHLQGVLRPLKPVLAAPRPMAEDSMSEDKHLLDFPSSVAMTSCTALR